MFLLTLLLPSPFLALTEPNNDRGIGEGDLDALGEERDLDLGEV